LATDYRDRVFALKTLVGSKEPELEFLIDYTQSFEETFTQVAQFLLPVLGLRMLVAIRHAHLRIMPPWVPDWSQNTPLEWAFFSDIEHLNPASNGSPVPRLRLSSEQKHVVRSSILRDDLVLLELHVMGCQYVQIIENSEAFLFDSLEDAELQLNEFCIGKEGIQDFAAASQRFGKRILDGIYMVI
jgi:hypothetical protein